MGKRDIGLYSVESLLLLLVDFGNGTMPAVLGIYLLITKV